MAGLTGLILIAIVVVLRWLRAALIGSSAGIPARYIFIYLCALEILPAALALQQTQRILPVTIH